MIKVYKSHLKMNHYKRAHTKNYQIPKKIGGYLVTHIRILGVALTYPKIMKSPITN